MDALAPLAILFGFAAVIWVWWRIKSGQAKAARDWPLAEATIISGQLESVGDGDVPLQLPVFAFYYHIGPDYYSGRFALRPYTVDPGESLIPRMIGRKLQVHCNPRTPGEWYVPDKLIEGCKVEQRLGVQVFNYAPRD